MRISVLSTSTKNYDSLFSKKLSVSDTGHDVKLSTVVARLLKDICTNGDAALLEHTKKFDKWKPKHISDVVVSPSMMASAFRKLPATFKASLTLAKKRLLNFAKHESIHSFEVSQKEGSTLAQKILPIERVGLYAPGGSASYFSSLLMNAIPAQVAGVKQIAVATPAIDNSLSDYMLATAHICGITEMYKIGGASAIAAFAYGTKTIKPVDKIFGPGNRYTTEAKRQLFGTVGIDMIAGPTEIVIICDAKSDPKVVAADLLAQAEHDDYARAIALSSSEKVLSAIKDEIAKQTKLLPRRDIIIESFKRGSFLMHTKSLGEAIDIANQMAPEHLHLNINSAKKHLNKIKNAGAVFVGPYSSESFGDYCAGPNHVLPTNRNSRFNSPLGTYSFQKRINIISLTKEEASKLAPHAACLAEAEGLLAHASSASMRKMAVRD